AQLPAFEDGVFLVTLAPLADHTLVAPAIAAMVGVTETAGRSLVDCLMHALRGKHLLLVLDNFEHLLQAAPLVGDLVRSCPSLQILVTSREILHLSMEREFPVPPLSLPDSSRGRDPESLCEVDAVAFFVDRAQAARPDFVVTSENAPSVAAICHRLDGLPLALELAASRIRLFPPRALLDRLSSRLTLLTGGPHDRPTRQQTLRATMDWSYRLLASPEQILCARLSVFAGGCTLDAAEAVCTAAGDLPMDVLDGMASLVEKSLVRQEGERWSRFVILETIREYAAEKLDERGEAEEFRRHHARYFLDFAEAIRPQLDGPEQIEGLNRLEAELNNLRAAVGWACDRGEVEVGLRLAIASEYLYMRGHTLEMAGWFQRLLAVERREVEQLNPSLRALALQLAAAYASGLGNLERVRALTEESIALIGELQDRREVAYRLQGAGGLLREQAEYERATALLEEALSMFTEMDDKAGRGVVLINLAGVAQEQGDAAWMIELSKESLVLSREVDNKPYVTFALHTLAVAARVLGDLDRARALCEEALELNRHIGLVASRGEILASLASVAREQGDLDEAETLLAEGLELSLRGAHGIEITARILEAMAGLAAARGRVESAAALFGAADALRERIGRPVWPVNRRVNERDLESVRTTMGEERFTRVWAAGRAMPLEDAITYAPGELPAAEPESERSG
ncbi:MAG: hypothetical protein JOZ41_00360, partial [Chloroflexi bacterium]|nr:hypothetical protein [Chloroflexota bacterium]